MKFSVKGMTCSACSAGIEKAVNKLDGVINATVSLMDESMTAEFDDGKLTVEDICTVVNKLGYSAAPFGKEMPKKNTAADRLKIRFISSLVLLLPLMYFSMGAMVNFPLPSTTANYAVQLVLATVILLINFKFFSSGSRAVWHRAPNMDTLVSLGAAASYLFSIVEMGLFFAGKSQPKHMFFESAAMVVTLVTLGKWLEDKSKRQTGREIEKLSKLIPNTVTILRDGAEISVSTQELRAGDELLFRAGDYVAVDGTVKRGNAFIDKSALTGESLPVEVTVDDEVTSGSILKSGYLIVTAEKTGDDTLFAGIIRTVREAGASKAPVQRFADKVAGIFVPVVSVIALITFTIWILVTRDLYSAFNFGVSVLVISCPCALGLATPVAVMAATGKAASFGILYKDAESLQKSEKIDCFLLDKTATLTVGQPKVVDVRYFFEDKALILTVSAAIENQSNHPIAQCIKEYAGITDKEVTDYNYVIGKGAEAVVDGIKYRIGNRALIADIDGAETLEREYSEGGRTAVFLADGRNILAVFAIADYIKEDSREAVSTLTDMGIKTVMVTGDNEYAARTVAADAGISDYVAGVLPSDKAAVVKQYMEAGNKTAMVGDGINDSPALKTADLGIAIGTGTDVAIDSADIVLVNGSLKGLADIVRLGKKAVGIIKGNLFWAFFYNVLAIPVAAGALSTVGVTLTPSIAAACMSISSLFVVFNALRITAYKSNFKNKTSFGKGEGKMNRTIVTVDGMMCRHCVAHVTEALKKLAKVTDVRVDLQSKTAEITSSEPLSAEVITAAIIDAGYQVISIS